MDEQHAFEANRALWNARTPHHIASRMYDMESFLAGRNSLTALELELLGDVRGKRILHLQCHFGQDTLSLARMGAMATGLDISDVAIGEARRLAERMGLEAEWVLSNVVEHRPELDGLFDVVFTSYGTIGWLPDLKPWAANIRRYLKPGGRFIFVEFHPMVWMFDNEFKGIAYSYFNNEVIFEEEEGTYAERTAGIKLPTYSWNHPLTEVLGALLAEGLALEQFRETDGSPHDCFLNAIAGPDGMFRIRGLEGKIPMVYGLTANVGS